MLGDSNGSHSVLSSAIIVGHARRMETFTLFVLLAANICGTPPPILQTHICGMPKPVTYRLTEAECAWERERHQKAGDHAYCVLETDPVPNHAPARSAVGRVLSR
jgi:hypothetical protein